jgi:hypothetical protein
MHPAERKQNLQRLQRELKHLKEEPVPGVHAAVSFLFILAYLHKSSPRVFLCCAQNWAKRFRQTTSAQLWHCSCIRAVVLG